MPARVLLVLAALLFSTGGAAIKYNTLTAWQVACLRSAVAASVLWMAIPAVRRRWTPQLFAVGCAYATMLILFVSATKLTTAANAIFLQSTAPIYLLLIGPVFLKEPLRRSDWLLMGAMGAGMSLFFLGVEPSVATAPNPKLGNLLAAGSGLAWALTVAGLRWTSRAGARGDASIVTVFAGNVIGFAVAFWPAMPVTNFDLRDLLVILYLGTCQIALAYFLLTRAIRHVNAFESAAILLVEPALNPTWTWLLLGEQPGELAIYGGAILLTAAGVNAWWQSRQRPIEAPAQFS